jgi:16S rRNA (cytosine967-C5)-methyltransferase
VVAKSSSGAPPLWRQLQGAALVLSQVREGRSATAALERVESGLRPGVLALSHLALRRLGAAQAVRAMLARKPPPPAADSLLCCALALAMSDQRAPAGAREGVADDPATGAAYDSHTLVNQAVEAAKRDLATRAQANFINACLRRFLRERATLLLKVGQDPVARWNHPRWWLHRLQRDHPQHWQAILEASNQQAPMTLRVNLRRGSVQDCLDLLQQAGLEARRCGPAALELEQARPVQAIPGFREGRWSVQDAAAQLAAPLLLGELMQAGQPASGQGLLVLDACAAPGGKTGHLLELADCQVVALDIDPARCENIRQNLARLGLQARVAAADAALPQSWLPALGLAATGAGAVFDAILLDAPCTASGIVRRHPDVRWLRRESDIEQSAALQARLLAALWPLLKPGGRLLYAVCSVFRDEGEGQVRSFLANNSDALLRPAPGHLLPLSAAPEHGLRDNRPCGHDGFFYALLERVRS